MEFDLVVFDEASQITVPDAIGALGRAARLCGRGRLEADAAVQPSGSWAPTTRTRRRRRVPVVIPDEESILSECVQAGLPRLWLSWHYRSQDECLIASPTRQYYEDRLSSVPGLPGAAPRHRRQRSRGSRGRSSAAAAAAPRRGCCGPTRSRRRRWWRRCCAAGRQRERSIGVVTFNIQQRALIESMLWDSEVEGVREALAAEGRRAVRQEPGERPGRRARRDHLLHRILGRRERCAAAELRAAEPVRRRAATQCRGDPGAAAGDGVLARSSRRTCGRSRPRRWVSSTCGGYLEQAKYGVPRAGARRAGRRSTGTPRQIARRCARPAGRADRAVGLSEFRIDLAVARPAAARCRRLRSCWTVPRGPSQGHDRGPRRRTRSACSSRSWAGRPWPGSGCPPGCGPRVGGGAPGCRRRGGGVGPSSGRGASRDDERRDAGRRRGSAGRRRRHGHSGCGERCRRRGRADAPRRLLRT